MGHRTQHPYDFPLEIVPPPLARAILEVYTAPTHSYDPSLKGLLIELIPAVLATAGVILVIYRLTTPPKVDPNAPLDPESLKLKNELDALSRDLDKLEQTARARQAAPPAAPPPTLPPSAPPDDGLL